MINSYKTTASESGKVGDYRRMTLNWKCIIEKRLICAYLLSRKYVKSLALFLVKKHNSNIYFSYKDLRIFFWLRPLNVVLVVF